MAVGKDEGLRGKLVGHQRQFCLLLISLNPTLEMSCRRISCDSLAWMVYNADAWESAYRNIVSFIFKNALLCIQQLSYCNLSSYQSSRH